MRFRLANDNIPICVVRFIGDPENCFNISTRRRPLVNRFTDNFVSLPKSATNCENDCNSINNICANRIDGPIVPPKSAN